MSFRYVRGALHNILPDETTLWRWMTKIDASPGFTAQALDHIKNHVESEKEAGRIRKSCDLLNLKNRGGLVTPGVHIDLIIKTANQLLETVKSEKNIYSEKNIIEKMYVNVKRILDVKQHNFLSFLDEHTDIMNSGSHRALLIKKVVSIFLTLRLKHMAKLKNLSLTNKRIRKTYSKLILFKSQ